MKLDGRRCLITGGGRGIGRAIALAFALEGAHVAVGARTESEVKAVAREVEALGRKSLALVADVAEPEQVRGMVRAVEEALGPVEVLVNNAGILDYSSVVDHDDTLWERIIRVNLTGTYLCTKAALPEMLKAGWGRVINIASTSGKLGGAHRSAYHSSKHAVIGFTRSAALEVAQKGITVNAICPGFVNTRMVEDNKPNFAEVSGMGEEETTEAFRKGIPMGRFLEPEEIAPLAVYLASQDSRGMTGQAINISCGETMH